MQRPAAGEIEYRERVQMFVVSAADDGAFSLFWHDERERGRPHLPRMDRDCIFQRHVKKHASQPVVGHGGDEIRRNRQLGTAKRGGDRIAPERDRIRRGNVLLVSDRKPVSQKRHVDIRLPYEERLHALTPVARMERPRNAVPDCAALRPGYAATTPQVFLATRCGNVLGSYCVLTDIPLAEAA